MPVMPTDADTARRWAEHWIAAWNALDIEAVLALFAEDCRFRSPKAAVITGHGTVIGKAALRDYYMARSPGAGLVWIYCERLGAQGAVWYLHGLFA